MHHLAPEAAQARDVGPLGLVELAARRDEHVGGVVYVLARREVGHLDAPELALVVPRAMLHLVPRLDEARGPEPLGHVGEVLLDLAPGRVEVGPVRVGGERVLVRVCFFYLSVSGIWMLDRDRDQKGVVVLTWDITGNACFL